MIAALIETEKCLVTGMQMLKNTDNFPKLLDESLVSPKAITRFARADDSAGSRDCVASAQVCLSGSLDILIGHNTGTLGMTTLVLMFKPSRQQVRLSPAAHSHAGIPYWICRHEDASYLF